jgi:Tannase and feruloyl esterase
MSASLIGHSGSSAFRLSEFGNELEGILANAPAIYWTRFQTAQMWGQIAMKDLAGGPIAAAKLTQTQASAVQACDAADGVTDGIIGDPRTCTFSATANICGAPNAPAQNCLTQAEAQAIDKIWDGPRNSKGRKVWFGLDRGTSAAAISKRRRLSATTRWCGTSTNCTAPSTFSAQA